MATIAMIHQNSAVPVYVRAAAVPIMQARGWYVQDGAEQAQTKQPQTDQRITEAKDNGKI